MVKSNPNIDYFPLSVATGQAFCNRKDEMARLQTCIEHKRPALLTSPRRYGKTSLALHVMEKMKLPYAQIDLFSAIDEYDIESIILNGVSRLILKIERLPKRAAALAKKIFEGTHVHVVTSNVEFVIETKRKKEKSSYRILDVLDRLERLTEKSEKKSFCFSMNFNVSMKQRQTTL